MTTQTRRKRKQERKLRQQGSHKEQKASNKDIDELSWAMAKMMTQIPVENVNELHFCETCHQRYCIAYNGSDQFCRDCYYKDCCLKQDNISIHKTCKHCGGEKNV